MVDVPNPADANTIDGRLGQLMLHEALDEAEAGEARADANTARLR